MHRASPANRGRRRDAVGNVSVNIQSRCCYCIVQMALSYFHLGYNT